MPSWGDAFSGSSNGGSSYSGPSAREKYPRGPKTHMARDIFTLLNSSDKESRTLGVQKLQENYHTLTPRLQEEYGLKDLYESLPKAEKPKGFDAFKHGVFRNRVVKGALVPFELAGRPQQAVGEGIQQVIHDTGLGKNYRKGSKKEWKGSGGGYGDIIRALQGKERTNLSGEKVKSQGASDVFGTTLTDKAWKKQSGLNKVLWRTTSFIGDAGMDPLTVAMAGTDKAAVKAGQAAAAKVVAEDIASGAEDVLTKGLAKRLGNKSIEDLSNEEIQQAIKRTGRKALTEDQIKRTTARIAEGVGETRKTRGLFGLGAREVPLQGDKGVKGFLYRTMWRDSLRDAPTRISEDTVTEMLRHDRGGFRLFDRSIVPAAVRDVARPLLIGDKVFTTNAERAAGVFDTAQTEADRAAARAEKASEAANIASGKAEALRTKHQKIPFSKIEDKLIDARTTLEDLKTATPSGEIISSEVPDDVRRSLTDMSLKLDERVSKLHGPTGLPPDPAVAPEAAALSAKADRIREMVANGDYEGLLAELESVTRVVRQAGDLTENDIPAVSKAAQEVQKEMKGTVTGLRREQEAARKEALRTGRQAEKEAAKAEKLLADLGNPDNVKIKPSIAKALKAQEERAAQFAERARVAAEHEDTLRSGLAAGDTEALLAHDPGLGSNIPYRKDVPSLVGRAPGAQRAKDLLKTTFRSRKGFEGVRLGEGARDAHYAITEREIGPRVVDTEALVRKIGSLHRSVEGGLFTPEAKSIMLDAFERPGGATETAALLRDAGHEELAHAVDVLHKMRMEDAKALIKEKVFRPEDLLRGGKGTDSYLAHRFTDDGAKAIQEALNNPGNDPFWIKASRKFNATKKVGEQGGSTKARALTEGMTIPEAEKFLADKLQAAGVEVPKDGIMVSDPVTLIAKRHEEVQNAITQGKIFKQMETKIKAADGGDLVGFVPRGLSDAEQARLGEAYGRRGLEKVDAGGGNTIYVHPDLKDEVVNIKRVLSDDEAIAAMEKSLAYVTKMWKGYATVFPGKGGGFFMRNMESNILLNSFRGITNPAEYLDAYKMMREARDARKAFPELTIPEAMVKNGVDPARVAEYESALETRAIKTGFWDVDMAADPMAEVENAHASRGQKAKTLLNPFSPDNAAFKAGSKIQGAIEDHARLTHYLHVLRETGSVDGAAASVKKYLFDYGDLTNAERRLFKNVMPFYTFARKNTPLVVSVFAKDPSKINRIMFAQKAILGNGEPQDNQRIPEYLQNSNTLLSPSLAAALTGDNKNPVVGGFDTPLDAAAKSFAPVMAILGATPGVQNLMPEGSKNQSAADILGSIINTTGGPIPEAIKFAFDEHSGVDSFTGAPLKDAEGHRRVSIGLKIAQIFNPAITPTLRLYGVESVFGQRTGGAVSDTKRQRFIEALTGVQSTRVTDQMSYKQFKYEIKQLEDAMDALKKSGVAVPTMQELRDNGIVPDYRSSSSGGSRPSSVAGLLGGGGGKFGGSSRFGG